MRRFVAGTMFGILFVLITLSVFGEPRKTRSFDGMALEDMMRIGKGGGFINVPDDPEIKDGLAALVPGRGNLAICCSADGKTVFMVTHLGVFRGDSGGRSWVRVASPTKVIPGEN